ncbi:pyridoxal phosphate-dependent decarboxylase family protein [Epibacterium ulvae]|uniref:pyridoxal phosphate-dependent decarboxylase family protein n=1 Tax=Epibacterium ulvae TaxID=1156985 RepID=UPI00203DD47F|nr:pyridoxal-dependent decarboxylase [Epibacterium ulvae]
MLDDALTKMKTTRDGRVWTPLPEKIKEAHTTPLPRKGTALCDVQRQIADFLPYNVGNTHPRFFGWVHGAGSPGNMIADIAAAAMNANLGGRDHGAMYVEKQVIRWIREMFDFPDTASGLVVSGTSIATIIALKSARDSALAFDNRLSGHAQGQLVGYTSTQTHSCVARAFDILGLGSNALRKIPVDHDFQIDLDALKLAIARDQAAGLRPFAIIGTAGSVNVGAIDDLSTLATIAEAEDLWLHIDGAFGAAGILSEDLAPRLEGLKQADSIAFDFHKWFHVNYDAGFVLIRSEDIHRRAFSDRPDYLLGATRGLAAGGHWPVDYGPELSRGFRALKIWEQFTEHGTEKIGQMITKNCRQAAYLGTCVDQHEKLELLAPVATSVCCFRYIAPQWGPSDLDRFNDELVIQLQLSGVVVPSVTKVDGKTAIRINITNHRTCMEDIDILLEEIDANVEVLMSTF